MDLSVQQLMLVIITSAAVLAYPLLIKSKRIQTIIQGQIQKWNIRSLSQAKKRGDEHEPSKIKVSSLFVHPIKSLRPVAVQSISLTHLGLAYDRSLMLVRPSGSTGQYRFLTQRQCPPLATITASYPVDVEATVASMGGLSLLPEIETLIKITHSSSSKSVHVNISPKAMQRRTTKLKAGLWSDQVEVVDLGDEAAQFIQSIILSSNDGDGDKNNEFEDYTDVRLVAQVPNDNRRVDARYCPASVVDLLGRVPKVSLTDGFPILIVSEESLTQLNHRLTAKGKPAISMSRFRPNIVVKGLEKAFGEDEWKIIQIGKGGPILHIVKGCPRCKQSCTDQVTGERFDEPLETLKDFREIGGEVYFAQNALLQPGHVEGKMIRVGDDVRILSKGDPVWDIDEVQAE